jgi:hypothetical protein
VTSTRNTSYLLLLALVATACAVPVTEVAGDVGTQESTKVDVATRTTEAAKVGLNEPNSEKESDCPVTIPPGPRLHRHRTREGGLLRALSGT